MHKHYLLIVLLISTPSMISPSILPSYWWFLGPSSQQQELMSAILTHQVDQAESLLEKGASPNFIDSLTENTPLGATCASTLMDTDTKKKFIKLLCDHGVDVNMTNNFGTTPLIEALRMGDYDIVQLLLQSNANPNTGHIELWGHKLNPLAYAHYLGRQDMIALLQNFEAENLTKAQLDNLSMARFDRDTANI